VLARALASKPGVMLLDEPTRGIDVGAHAEIILLIRRLCEQGLALLVASSELDEVVVASDRVVVLRDREMIGEIAGSELNRDNIVHMIAGTDDRQQGHARKNIRRSPSAGKAGSECVRQLFQTG
jgi:simple sugar transport system ATP-binding protein